MLALATDKPTSDGRAYELDGLYQLENAILAKRLLAVAAFDRDELWREDACHSMADWLALRNGYPMRTAARMVKVAHALEDRPRIAHAFGEGLLSYDVVCELCTFVPPEDDAFWAERAQHLNAAQIAELARHRRRLLRRDAALLTDRRYLTTRWSETDAMLRIYGRIPGAEGAAVGKALERLTEKMGPSDDGTWEPYDQRCADALVDMCRMTLSEDADADRASVVLHVDLRDLNRINGLATFEDGPSVPAEIGRRISCDARLQIVIDGPNGEPLGIGRTSRTIPPWLYKQVKKRDGACVVCGRRRGVQAHHKIHWAHGGPTDLDNLVLLCWCCHRKVHDEGFRLAKNQHGVIVLVRPDGRPVRRRPYPLRPETKERFLGPARPKRRIAALRR